jgi:hypothetical protein
MINYLRNQRKKKMKNSVKSILAVSVLLTSSFVFAQRTDLGREEVDIFGGFNPVITDASKMGSNPIIRDTTSRLSVPEYRFINKKINTTFQVEPIAPAKMKGESLVKLYRSYIKGGFGNYTTPLAEVYINSIRSKEYSYVFNYDHISSTGNMADVGYPGFSRNNMGLSGKYFHDNYTVTGDLAYKRNVVHYYGYDANVFDFTDEETRQRFNFFSGKAAYQSNNKDLTKLNYETALSYYHLGDLYDTARENNVNLAANFSQYLTNQKFTWVVNSGLDYYFNNLPRDTSQTAIVKINPHAKLSDNKFKMKIGGNLFLITQTDDVGQLRLYPDIDLSYNLVENIIVPFAGVTGFVERAGYRSLTDVNPFLNANTELRNTNHKVKVFGGLKGSLSSALSFNTLVSYSVIDDMPFFINDTTIRSQNRFLVVYDNIKLLNISGEIAYQKSEKLRFSTKANYYSYQMSEQMLPWHMPDMDITFSTLYNLRDKIIVKGDVFYMNARYGRNHFSDGEPPVTGPFPVIVKGFADVNLGLEYRYTRNFSAFLNFNNIGAARYNRWNNFPVQRFNLIGGITYSF